MLATLAVILWAYGMYALFSFIFHRQGVLCPQSKPLAQAEPAYPGGWGHRRGGAAWFGVASIPDKHDQRLKLAGFLGTVYAEGWPDRVDQSQISAGQKPEPGVIGAAGLCPAASGDARQSDRTGKEASQTQAGPGCPQGALRSPPG